MAAKGERPRIGVTLLLLLCITAASEYTNTRRARAERRANANKNKTNSDQKAGSYNPNHCLPAVRGYKFAERPPLRKAKSKPLTACYEFSLNTCCTKNHTEAIKWFIVQAAAASFNGQCRDLTEKLNCMVCDPDVGRGRVNSVCPTLCQQWYDACSAEWYNGKMGGGLVPCYGDALVCSQLRDIADNAGQFCNLMGFPVAESNTHCYDGHAPTTEGEPELRGKTSRTKAAPTAFPELTDWQYLMVYAALILVIGLSAARYLLQPLRETWDEKPEVQSDDESEQSADSDEDDVDSTHTKFD